MGTNFYMITKNKELVKQYFQDEYEIVDEPYLSYEIHICKRNAGWKILYQAHKNAYDSVEKLLLFLKQHPEVYIYDEYGRAFSINQFEEDVVDWDKNYKKETIYYNNDIGEIQTPIDHVEISSRDRTIWNHKIQYWHDKDGYDFTEGDFL